MRAPRARAGRGARRSARRRSTRTRSRRRSAFLELARRRTTSPSSATASTTCPTRTATCGCAAVAGLGPRHPAPGGGEQSSRRLRAAAARRVRALALEPYLLNLTKANSRATVHRPAYLDYVGVKRFDDPGRVIGERRFLGLYTHTPTTRARSEIPILRRKVDGVLARAAFPPDSHNEKALLEILETYPRDELFQISGRRAVRHRDGDPPPRRAPARCGCSCAATRSGASSPASCSCRATASTPRTAAASSGSCARRSAPPAIDYTTRVSESVLVRLHYMVYTRAGAVRDYDAARDRGDARRGDALLGGRPRGGAGRGARRGARQRLFRRYGDAFPPAYRADWVARSALADIERIEELPAPDGLAMSLYRPLEAPAACCARSSSARAAPLALSDMLPMFENMGVRGRRRAAVRDHAAATAAAYWIYDFGLTYERRRRARRRRAARALPGRVPRAPGTATSRTTASTAWCCAAG